ncbi:hypothetical protein SAMN04490248_11613 [Salinihabitans flavidus]|uniref:Uncharacterized protein n=1 Tax=Salinihabitans flavidus TaxID=569882 RepID=A0A1H8TLL3_9RHOB|nr:hypothetical protein [Salinihabitans flavidus]SEO91735.1 hypothetical protein SAMN04490248_11613 [Salinihabitans flavidus]
MRQDHLETVYDALAEAIDAVGPAQSEVYLAKVAIALAERLGSTASLAAIEECKTGFVDAGSVRRDT